MHNDFNVSDASIGSTMDIQTIGRSVRIRRQAHGLTQAELAGTAGLSRATVNAIENGTVSDIGVRKLMGLLGVLDASLAVTPTERKSRPDFLKIAATSAGVSFREQLSADELARILVTGRLPRAKRAHVRALFNEAPASVWRGLLGQLAPAVPRSRLAGSLQKLARDVGSTRNISAWLTGD